MYSGMYFTRYTGRWFGGHQKIDRVAHRVLSQATDMKHFPDKKTVILFEGWGGPDSIKVKSPAVDEPWHFIDPFDPGDTQLLEIVREHRENLAKELKNGNMERAGFEAAWLAHALVDGLTPAHHYPYEETLVELRKGATKDSRTTFKEKLVMKGDTKSEVMRNNWRMWGFKGLLISHAAYEVGVAAIISPFIFRQVKIDKKLIARVKDLGFEEYYLQTMREIALWNMYDEFERWGWTWSLSKKTRDDLVPKIIEVVAVSWYLAMQEAGKTTRLKS